jgi:hypothetical protein
MIERRSTLSREMRYWQSQRMTRIDKLAMMAMLVIFVVGLYAVWSVR